MSVTGCDKKKASGSSWEHNIRIEIQSRDLGWRVGSSYLQSLSVKGKRSCVLAISSFLFFFFLSELEQVCRWEGENPWTGKTEDGSLIVVLDT